jgi:two-component system sensor histidine kinase UhpB
MRRSLFWRVFAVNAGLLGGIAVLLLVSPIEIDSPIRTTQALIVVAGLAITLAANAILLRRAFMPLERLVRRMETVDLLRPGQRLRVQSVDEVGRVVSAFNHMLDRLESERHENGRRVLAAQEAERIGIARDLHDEVGQLLTAVLLQLNSIAELASTQRVEIDQAREAVRRALEEVRRISRQLRPELLEQLGLVSALTELSTTFARASGVLVQREFEAPLPRLSPETELAIYRIAQESLTNVARHSEAAHVMITLAHDFDSVVLRVVDDGCGFGGAPVEHGGLRSMRERALSIGGVLEIDQGAAGGVDVRLEVPTARGAQVAAVA